MRVGRKAELAEQGACYRFTVWWRVAFTGCAAVCVELEAVFTGYVASRYVTAWWTQHLGAYPALVIIADTGVAAVRVVFGRAWLAGGAGLHGTDPLAVFDTGADITAVVGGLGGTRCAIGRTGLCCADPLASVRADAGVAAVIGGRARARLTAIGRWIAFTGLAAVVVGLIAVFAGVEAEEICASRGAFLFAGKGCPAMRCDTWIGIGAAFTAVRVLGPDSDLYTDIIKVGRWRTFLAGHIGTAPGAIFAAGAGVAAVLGDFRGAGYTAVRWWNAFTGLAAVLVVFIAVLALVLTEYEWTLHHWVAFTGLAAVLVVYIPVLTLIGT